MTMKDGADLHDAGDVLWGKLLLRQGISKKNMATYFVFMFVAIAVLVFMNTAQPFVINSILRVNPDNQGEVSGDAAFYGEIMQISTIGAWGALSDKIGRKVVTAIGLLICGTAFAAYPFATSVLMLYVYRLLYSSGVGAVNSFMTVGLADYPHHTEKGKAAGFMGVFSGLGALFALFVIVQIAAAAEAFGAGPVASGRIMYIFVVILCVAAAFLCVWGLKDPAEDAESVARSKRPLLELMKEGVAAGIADPVLMLSYFGAFVSRGDSSILNIFLSLWVNQWASDNDYTSTEAIAMAGMMVGVSQAAAMCLAPVWGYYVDKKNKIVVLNWSTVIAAAGYLIIGFRNNPTDEIAYLACVIIGIGQIGGIIGGQALVAYHSPDEIAGSVAGVFGFTGASGILVITKLGGFLFDEWREGGPLILLAIFNLMQCFWGLVVLYVVKDTRPPHLRNVLSQDTTPLVNP